jgi:nicotinamidase-related amidase
VLWYRAFCSPPPSRTAKCVTEGACTGQPVPGGEEVVPLVVALRESGHFDLVVYSQDWHPRDHVSFSSVHPDVPILTTIEVHCQLPHSHMSLDLSHTRTQMPQWTQLVVPDHCVQNTWGAQFHPGLGLKEGCASAAIPPSPLPRACLTRGRARRLGVV